ncbi:MAG: hypothetical protein EZS28_016426 [Streblomastix strix]|uniref:Cell morphogenesis protein N-terminal domain-containing protein n=1 Tax=Streblomastix strix TaxID=222440 RepID=A0A5J4W0J6_9EUKA|nr:MAG: hypothetical protein EZS28_016426 [Streblomastix strix]
MPFPEQTHVELQHASNQAVIPKRLMALFQHHLDVQQAFEARNDPSFTDFLAFFALLSRHCFQSTINALFQWREIIETRQKSITIDTSLDQFWKIPYDFVFYTALDATLKVNSARKYSTVSMHEFAEHLVSRATLFAQFNFNSRHLNSVLVKNILIVQSRIARLIGTLSLYTPTIIELMIDRAEFFYSKRSQTEASLFLMNMIHLTLKLETQESISLSTDFLIRMHELMKKSSEKACKHTICDVLISIVLPTIHAPHRNDLDFHHWNIALLYLHEYSQRWQRKVKHMPATIALSGVLLSAALSTIQNDTSVQTTEDSRNVVNKENKADKKNSNGKLIRSSSSNSQIVKVSDVLKSLTPNRQLISNRTNLSNDANVIIQQLYAFYNRLFEQVKEQPQLATLIVDTITNLSHVVLIRCAELGDTLAAIMHIRMITIFLFGFNLYENAEITRAVKGRENLSSFFTDGKDALFQIKDGEWMDKGGKLWTGLVAVGTQQGLTFLFVQFVLAVASTHLGAALDIISALLRGGQDENIEEQNENFKNERLKKGKMKKTKNAMLFLKQYYHDYLLIGMNSLATIIDTFCKIDDFNSTQRLASGAPCVYPLYSTNTLRLPEFKAVRDICVESSALQFTLRSFQQQFPEFARADDNMNPITVNQFIMSDSCIKSKLRR